MAEKFVNIKYLAVGLSIAKDHYVLAETGTIKGDDSAYSASVKQVLAAPQTNVPGTKYSLAMKDNTTLNFYTDQQLRVFSTYYSISYLHLAGTKVAIHSCYYRKIVPRASCAADVERCCG